MGVSKEQAAENRNAIVETASRVFRERGVDGVGVADLMKEAGFTHGGFYNHFKSKEALAAEACEAVFEWALTDIRTVVKQGTGGPFNVLLQDYLSERHRDDPGHACPTGALVTDAARQGGEMQAAFSRGIEQFIEAFSVYFLTAPGIENDAAQARKLAMRLLADIVGTVALARGTAEADPKLSSEILEAGRARLPV
jgi:TetR/AcrR family transcriptional repressor of nem operon